MAYGYLNKYDATNNVWKEHGANNAYVRKYYEGVHYMPVLATTAHYDGYSAFGTQVEAKTGDNQFKYITFCVDVVSTEINSEQYIIMRGNWLHLEFSPYQMTIKSGMNKSTSESFTATLSYIMEYDPQRDETYIKITDWVSTQLNGNYIYFGVYNPNWTAGDVYGLIATSGHPKAASKRTNSEWLSNMRFDVGEYFFFSHKRGNEIEILQTTSNIGVNVEVRRAGTGYQWIYTQISSNTPMRFIEQSISEPRTITITHPTSTTLKFFTADTTGGDNFSNFTDATVSTATDGNNTIYTITLPANKRLLICYQYSYTPTGQYTYKADYYGITPDKATVGTMRWL